MQSNRPPRGGDKRHTKRKDGPREYQQYRQNSSRPRHPDKEVDQRIRELDAERDPLSLPEEIVSEANKAGQRVGIPTGTSDGPQLNVALLQQMQLSELVQKAEEDGLGDVSDVTKQDLIFRILKHRMKADGLMYGEGTLEILPDGFGFLRSSEYHYLSWKRGSVADARGILRDGRRWEPRHRGHPEHAEQRRRPAHGRNRFGDDHQLYQPARARGLERARKHRRQLHGDEQRRAERRLGAGRARQRRRRPDHSGQPRPAGVSGDEPRCSSGRRG